MAITQTSHFSDVDQATNKSHQIDMMIYIWLQAITDSHKVTKCLNDVCCICFQFFTIIWLQTNFPIGTIKLTMNLESLIIFLQVEHGGSIHRYQRYSMFPTYVTLHPKRLAQSWDLFNLLLYYCVYCMYCTLYSVLSLVYCYALNIIFYLY